MKFVQLFLFFLCLNFGLGFAHIPNTPITIPDAYQRCYADYSSGKLVMFTNSTFAKDVNSTKNSIAKPANPDNATQFWNPITDSVETVYTTGVIMKNLFLGGYISNTLENLNVSCVKTTDANGHVIYTVEKSDIWSYFIGGINVLFGLLLIITLYYLVRGQVLI